LARMQRMKVLLTTASTRKLAVVSYSYLSKWQEYTQF